VVKRILILSIHAGRSGEIFSMHTPPRHLPVNGTTLSRPTRLTSTHSLPSSLSGDVVPLSTSLGMGLRKRRYTVVDAACCTSINVNGRDVGAWVNVGGVGAHVNNCMELSAVAEWWWWWVWMLLMLWMLSSSRGFLLLGDASTSNNSESLASSRFKAIDAERFREAILLEICRDSGS
jgi:hypothetical protein